MKIKPRHIALAGILLAVSAILANTPLGMIPIPTPARYATIMHIPVIIVGILEGPIMGGIIGLLFGLIAFLKVPEFGPIVHLVPRPLVGIIPALVYMGIIRITKGAGNALKETIAISVATVMGSLVNTAGVLGLAVMIVPNLMPVQVAGAIALTNGLPEAFFSVIITVPVVLALRKRFPMRYAKECVSKSGNEENGT